MNCDISLVGKKRDKAKHDAGANKNWGFVEKKKMLLAGKEGGLVGTDSGQGRGGRAGAHC